MSGSLTAGPGEARGETGVRRCWSCRGPAPDAELFCPTCGALQPPLALDHFRRLGLERSYEVDRDELDRSYFRYQRLLHPDRFATRTAKERALSLQHATGVNDAYRTLGDPLRRAEYLLSLHGRTVNSGAETIDDPDLLGESMARREALAQAEDSAAVETILAAASADGDACQGALAAAFAAGDIERAAKAAVRLRYLHKLAAEARAERSRLGSGAAAAAATP